MATSDEIKKYICPRCQTEIEISPSTLEATGGTMVCPNCQAKLQIVGDYAYIPLEGQDFEAEARAEQQSEQPEAQPASDPDFDPLLHDAVEYLKTLSAVSVPQLARYFGVDLQRAQLLMDHLERKGIVGPSTGGGPRSILIEHNQGLGSPFGHSRTLETDQEERAMLEQLRQLQNQEGGPKVRTFGCSCFSVVMFLLLLLLLMQLFK